MPQNVNPTMNILVVKTCCLGDMIFMTPMLRSLKHHLPGARITLLGSSWVADLTASIPAIDDCITFDAAFAGSLTTKVLGTLRLLRELRRRDFDCAIICHRNRMFAWLTAMAGIPIRIGFQGSQMLTVSVPYDETRHETERYLAILDALQIPPTDTHTELQPPVLDAERRQALLQRLGIPEGRQLIGLFPGGGENPGTIMTIKRWSLEDYAAVVRELIRDERNAVVLFGGVTDTAVNASLLALIGPGPHVVDLAGKTNLTELLQILGTLSVFVGGDTGPTHMAAAVGTPTVALFGPSDPRLVAPRGERSVYLWTRPACSPCYTPVTVLNRNNFVGKEFSCRTGTLECMKTITTRAVLEQIRKWL
jgi:lipopolysaccharide heptosyltransferase II